MVGNLIDGIGGGGNQGANKADKEKEFNEAFKKALFQAGKGVLDFGEKLGLNQTKEEIDKTISG